MKADPSFPLGSFFFGPWWRGAAKDPTKFLLVLKNFTMSLSEELKQRLQRNALQEPEQVSARNSQALRLNLGTRKVTLVNKYGQATAAGKYFYCLLYTSPSPRD